MHSKQFLWLMPKMPTLNFEDSRVFPLLAQGYNDATVERSLIQDGVNGPRSIRTYKLASRLVPPDAAAFKTFYGAHGTAIPLYWYNPFEDVPSTPSAPIGTEQATPSKAATSSDSCRTGRKALAWRLRRSSLNW